MPAPRLLAMLALGLALAGAGCSRESDEDQVRNTLERFADATAKKDYQALCDDLFATKLVEEVRRSVPCELALRNSDLGAAQKPTLRILRVRVDGERATADVRTGAANQEASEDTVELVREDDDWRIIALSSG
jgi:Putative lumazine-binding